VLAATPITKEALMAVSTATPQVRFAELFREEHRYVRDLLLDLVRALEQRRLPDARALVGEIAAVTGPHFRYEEESLYPALVAIFGPEYVEKLRDDHDGAIASARRIAELASRDALTDGEVDEAVRLVRGILPHVSDCDGLSIMVELLADETVERIFAARDAARAEGLDLLEWGADPRRARPVA
jgi:hypothetical protein